MKNVLVVADLSYAAPRISGLTKYLPRHGWKPTVISPQPPSVHTRHSRLRPLGALRPLRNYAALRYREAFHYPDAERKRLREYVDAGTKHLTRVGADAIISSSPPPTCHVAAQQLKQRFDVPWIADFRDLWSRNANYPYCWLRKWFDTKLERETLVDADALITVSQPLAQELAEFHQKQVWTVLNGFDPDELNVGTHLTDSFSVTFTGQIYRRNEVNKLLVALEHLLRKKALPRNDVDMRFYGPRNHEVSRGVDALKLRDVVHQHGIIDHEDTLQRQRETQVLLLFKWGDLKHRGIMTGKIFEYLAAKRPVLAVGGGDDVVSDLLQETGVGYDAQSHHAVETVLKRFYREYECYGATRWRGINRRIMRYSYVEMARKFVEVMNCN